MHTCIHMQVNPKISGSSGVPYFLNTLFSVSFGEFLVAAHYMDLVSGPTLSEKQGSNLQREVCKQSLI